MKKLLTLAALALSLGLSSQSFADSNIFGVQTPIKRNSVSNQVKGSYVEIDHSSFYLNPKDRTNVNSSSYLVLDNTRDNGFYVFGVKIDARS